MLSGSNRIVQNAWVVPDLLTAIPKWVDAMGVGPFFIMENIHADKQLYRGQPSDLIFDVALAQAGDVQIELIQQKNEIPSVYRDVVPEGESGFHHVAVIVEDYEKEVAAYRKRGYEVAMSAMYGVMPFIYFDTRKDLMSMVEVLPAFPDLLANFEHVRVASIDWDGSDPIRYLQS